MTAEPARKAPAPSLDEADLFAWTVDQANHLRARAADALDWENLAEEIESLGASEKREIRSRMIVLLHHLLKWEHQPERRCHSWQSTIGTQRTHLHGLLETSPSLRDFPAQVLASTYEDARCAAARETRLPLARFPAEPPLCRGPTPRRRLHARRVVVPGRADP